jgi:multidrug resistance efflux pump
MFLVTEERLMNYAPPVQIMMLLAALIGAVMIVYYTFWEEFYKVMFTDEPRVGADYVGVILAVAGFIVILDTVYRLGSLVLRESRKPRRE